MAAPPSCLWTPAGKHTVKRSWLKSSTRKTGFFYGFIHEATTHESYNPSFLQGLVKPAFKTVCGVGLALEYLTNPNPNPNLTSHEHSI